MHTERARITRNTIFIISALVGQKLISFLYFTMIARGMSVEETGRYFLAVSFTLLFSVLADIGFSPFIVRESAKLREGFSEMLRAILGAKLLCSGITFFAILGTAYALPYPTITKELIAIGAVSVIIESWHLIFYSLLRGWQRLEFEAIGMVGAQAVTLLFGVVAVFFFRSLHLLMVGLLVGNTLNLLWAFTMVRRMRIPISVSFTGKGMRMVLLAVVPFALAAVFARVTGYIDGILISLFAPEKTVGLYSVPFKVTSAFQFIPIAFSAALLPAMSGFVTTSKDLLAKTFIRGSLYLLYIVLPIAFGIASVADRLIPAVFGASYLDAVPTQRLMIMSLIFVFLNFPVGALLVATNRQKLNTTFIGMAMVTDIIINLIWIPRIGIMAPAIASVVANALLFFCGIAAVSRSIALPSHALLHGAAKGLIAASIMTTVLLVAKPFVNVFILLPIGAIVYALCLLLVRAVTVKEIYETYFAFHTRVSS